MIDIKYLLIKNWTVPSLVRLFNMKFNDQINEVTQYITNYS